MSQTFKKSEHLKSHNAFKALFSAGKSAKFYPVRMVYIPWAETPNNKTVAGFSVSKKRFKLAVDRNRIKRQLREAFRLNRGEILTNLKQPYAVVFIYLHHKKVPYETIQNSISQCLKFLEEADAK